MYNIIRRIRLWGWLISTKSDLWWCIVRGLDRKLCGFVLYFFFGNGWRSVDYINYVSVGALLREHESPETGYSMGYDRRKEWEEKKPRGYPIKNAWILFYNVYSVAIITYIVLKPCLGYMHLQCSCVCLLVKCVLWNEKARFSKSHKISSWV